MFANMPQQLFKFKKKSFASYAIKFLTCSRMPRLEYTYIGVKPVGYPAYATARPVYNEMFAYT